MGMPPALQHFDLGRVVVHADDVMADFGKTGSGDQTDVAGADDRQFHGLVLKVNGAGDVLGDWTGCNFVLN